MVVSGVGYDVPFVARVGFAIACDLEVCVLVGLGLFCGWVRLRWCLLCLLCCCDYCGLLICGLLGILFVCDGVRDVGDLHE